MHAKQIILAGIIAAVMAVVLFGSTVIASEGVDCAVLPDSICGAANEKQLEKSGVWRVLVWVINIMSAGVGIVAVGAIAFAGFLYSTARDDAGQTKRAISIITNTAIGILIYIFMFAILQYLIPGGIIGL